MKQQFFRQRGFSLVTAIFLLVVLAILGSYMALMSLTQNQSTALSVQGARAWYAAVSGYHWLSDYIFDPARGNLDCPSPLPTFTVEGFTLTVTDCTKTTVTESGSSYPVFDVAVKASRGNYGEVDYVQRTLRATLGES